MGSHSVQVIDADNACLFNAVAYCLENQRLDLAPTLRQVVASAVLESPLEYNQAVLGEKEGLPSPTLSATDPVPRGLVRTRQRGALSVSIQP